MNVGYKIAKLPVLALCLLLSVPIFGADYQVLRLSGQVMPTTGESKKVTISMAAVQEPLYVFVDYNYAQVPLSQRLELTSQQKSAEVTLMPGSRVIAVLVAPQGAVHEYLEAMLAYDKQLKEEAEKGVTLLKNNVERNTAHLPMNNLYPSTKWIANIFYDKIQDGEQVELPNPFAQAEPVESVERYYQDVEDVTDGRFYE